MLNCRASVSLPMASGNERGGHISTVLITGAGGYVGGNLAIRASSRHRTHASFHHCQPPVVPTLESLELDVTDARAVEEAFTAIAPDVVFHCAAVAGIDLCARSQRLAWQVNAEATRTVARAAERVGSKLVYLSTDVVFAGDKGQYAVQASPGPTCTYGKAKLAGELYIAEICTDYCIARASLILGWTSTASLSFPEKLINALRSGKSVRLLEDEYRTPTHIDNICEALIEMGTTDARGLFHLSANERLSGLELGLRTAGAFGLDGSLIVPTVAGGHPSLEPRPRDTSLVGGAAIGSLRTPFWGVDVSLRHMRDQMPTWLER